MANTFKNYVAASVGTTVTTVLTGATSAQTTVIGMTIANTTAANITASVTLNNGSVAVYLVKDATILPGGSLVPIGGDQKLVLQAGNLLQVQSNTAASLDVILSVLEIT